MHADADEPCPRHPRCCTSLQQMAHVLAMVPPRIVLVVLLLLLLPVVLLPAIVARRTVVPTVPAALGGMAS